MPTHEETAWFLREYRSLSRDQQREFLRVARAFREDVDAGKFRPSLRVKKFRSIPDTLEMSWAEDRRALWRYRTEIKPGLRHVIWLRIGAHDIYDRR